MSSMMMPVSAVSTRRGQLSNRLQCAQHKSGQKQQACRGRKQKPHVRLVGLHTKHCGVYVLQLILRLMTEDGKSI